MGKFVVRIKDAYCLWSTVVDAPVTPLYNDVEKIWHERGRGWIDREHFHNSVKLADSVGHSLRSMYGYTLDDVIACNRAGSDGSELSLDEIYDKYIFVEEPTK